MRTFVLAMLLAFAITIGPVQTTLAHQIDADTDAVTVRQSTVTVETPPFDEDDLSNQPLDQDDNHDNT